MNGFLKVNTFIRDIVFTNCQHLHTVVIVYDHRKYTDTRLETQRIETQSRSVEWLRLRASMSYKKRIYTTNENFSDLSLYNSYVTRWFIDDDTHAIYIWSTNMPKRGLDR